MISRIIDILFLALRDLLLSAAILAVAVAFAYLGPGKLSGIQLGILAGAGVAALVGAMVRKRGALVSKGFGFALVMLGLLAAMNGQQLLGAESEIAPANAGLPLAAIARLRADLPMVLGWGSVLAVIVTAIIAWLARDGEGEMHPAPSDQ